MAIVADQPPVAPNFLSLLAAQRTRPNLTPAANDPTATLAVRGGTGFGLVLSLY
jgi:hypothetical protein